MNLKNIYLQNTIRIVFGLFMIFAAVAGFMGAKSIVNGQPMEGISEKDIELTKAYWETGIIHLAKLMELVIGLMFIFNFLPALATVFLAPLSIGFIFYHSFASPNMLPIPIVIILINLYFAYIHWDKYKPILKCDKKVVTKKKK